MQPEDWEPSEEDTEDDAVMVASMGDEDGSKLLTRANLGLSVLVEWPKMFSLGLKSRIYLIMQQCRCVSL